MGQAKRIEAIAAACHEINRTYCESLGDESQPAWSEAPQWQRASAIEGVKAAMNGATPEQSHEGWLAQKEADGWVHGETKDPKAKTHPCMVPYEDLSPEQQRKDHLFTRTAVEMAKVIRTAP